jgi:hypothetical protein
MSLERFVYALLILLSLAALALVAVSPAYFAETKIVYQGF